jgi:hypothetical protein
VSKTRRAARLEAAAAIAQGVLPAAGYELK